MRPQFHFTARGWINDPHGITFAAGRYHVFFQYVPGHTSWRLGCSWGHASGSDLFSLEELPPALVPGDGDDGIWSGSLMVTTGGSPRIFYTSVSEQDPDMGRVRTATTADPNWISWEKGDVVAEAPSTENFRVFRDPAIVADGSVWRMLVGATLDGGVAAAAGFSSADGVTWQQESLVASRPGGDRDPVWSGSMWECPQIIEVDGRHALIVSVWDADELYDVLYALGTFEMGIFTPTKWGRLSYGPSLYAATAFRDRDNRACLLFWLRGVTGEGWAGAHSVPYRVTLSADEMSLSPHPDLEKYHDETAKSGNAADILWPEHAASTLQIQAHGRLALSTDRAADELRIHLGEVEYRLPWAGDIRLVVDGPILEVSSAAGVFAAPMSPIGADWELLGFGISVRPLRQHARA